MPETIQHDDLHHRNLFVRDGKKAIEFYQRAFGARVLYQSPMPHGDGIFAQIKIGESVVQIADETVASARQRQERLEGPDAVRPVGTWDASIERWTTTA